MFEWERQQYLELQQCLAEVQLQLNRKNAWMWSKEASGISRLSRHTRRFMRML